MADEVKENNKQLVCEIKIDAEIMRKIIDEKMTQIELDIQEIRAKAIDEMVEGIREILECNAIYNIDCIATLAEQLKAGGKNE